MINQGFPGGSVVKNPHANAGDTCLILDQEDSTCHGATKPAPQLLSACATTTEGCVPRACTPQQEEPLQ